MACSFWPVPWFSSLPQLLTLLGAAVLAIYDLRFMEYPLFIWCCLHALVLFLSGSNLFMLVFFTPCDRSSLFLYRNGSRRFSLTGYLFAKLFFYQDSLSHSDRIHLRHSRLCSQKRKRPDSLCSPVSFSVITLYCFIRYFADKFFLFCSLRF